MRIYLDGLRVKDNGVAASDPRGLTALESRNHMEKAGKQVAEHFARIEELAAEYGVEKNCCGTSEEYDNTLGERGRKISEFKEMLEKKNGTARGNGDERLTTMEANRVLMEGGVRREDRKEHLIPFAAD